MSKLYVNQIVEATAGAGVRIPGHVVQATQTEITSDVYINSTTWTDVASHSITPKSTSSKIKFTACISGQGNGSNSYNWMGLRILRGSTVIFEPHTDNNGPYSFGCNTGNGASVTVSSANNCFLTYLDSPSTSTSVTYKVQAAMYDTTVAWDFQHDTGNIDGTSIIILEEIAQ